MRRIWISMALAIACLLWSREAAAQTGGHVALVIGNSAYTATSPLRNPGNDAREMEKMFQELGFDEVRVLLDADQAQMIGALNAFADLAYDSDVAVVFYSGHGMELGGENHLIPIHARLLDDLRGKDESVSLDRARRAAGGARRLSMVIVDACRNNVFPTTSKNGPRGLAPISAADRRSGEVVVYSTAPGRIALDGTGNLSPFTKALAQSLRAAPDEDVRIWPTLLRLPDGQTPHVEAGGFRERHVSLLASGEAAPQTQPPIAPSHRRPPSAPPAPAPAADACALADAPLGFRCVMREGRASFEALAAPPAPVQSAPAQQVHVHASCATDCSILHAACAADCSC